MKRKMSIKKLVCLLSLLTALIVFLAGCTESTNQVQGDKTINIRMSSVKQQHQIAGKALISIADKLNESFNGKVNATAFTGGELFDGTQELQALLNKDVEMLIVFGARMESLDPRFQVFKMPFLFPDPKTAMKVLDGPAGDAVWAMTQEKGVKVLGFAPEGIVTIGNNKRPLKMPEDFNGIKLRVPGRIDTAMIEALGGSAMAIEPGETYTALQQNVIDGIYCPGDVFYDLKYYEVQDYVTDAGLLYLGLSVILVNDEWWSSLSADMRDGIQDIVNSVVNEWREATFEAYTNTAQRIADKGPEVHTLTPEEREAWIEATKPVYTKFADNLEPGMVEMLQEAVKATLKQS